MGYRLRAGLTVCMVAEQAVFLDIAQDRYFALAGAGAQTIDALLKERPPALMGVSQLTKAGVIVEAVGDSQLAPVTTVPITRSLLEEGGSSTKHRLAAVVEVALTVAAARRRLKHQALATTLDALAKRKAQDFARMRSSQQCCLEIASTWLAARHLVPIAPRCLPDSLALLDELSRHGLAADLVFGVKLNPFSAHCWVQIGGVVLNEAIDHANLHTPILVV